MAMGLSAWIGRLQALCQQLRGRPNAAAAAGSFPGEASSAIAILGSREGMSGQTVDLAIIGGGINGCGIARDAAGRGLSVFLCEERDLGGATSSASTKLIHGGLRYLEHYDFRLVHEALAEREVLLRSAPHIIQP